MLHFKRDKGADCPAYAVSLGEGDAFARIEQRDDWELPRRKRWSLDLRIDRSQRRVVFTLYFDTLAEAKQGVCDLLEMALWRALGSKEVDYLQLKKMAGA